MTELKSEFCIVGGGFAGLVAAYRLKQAGQSVVLLEARERVGGRTWTHYLPDGTAVELGGTFFGPGQKHAYDLAAEMGVNTFATHHEGDSLLLMQGKLHRYHGLVPDLDLFSLGSVWWALKRLDAMAKEVPPEKPWTAAKAREWDSMTIGQWIDNFANVATEPAREMLRMVVSGTFCADPSEVSFLNLLLQIATSNDFEGLLAIEGGSEQDQVQGGMGAIHSKLAEKLGDIVHLKSPVRKIVQDASGVTVTSDMMSVRAKRVIVAVPPALADRITFEPKLPPERAQLLQRMPAGLAMRFVVIYEEAFWRHDGLSGESAAPGDVIQVTIDGSQASGKPGILHSYSLGPLAAKLGVLSAEERKVVVLNSIKERFGEKATKPLDFCEQDWAADEWTRGCSMSHYAPGIMTTYGHVIREACGRIHWAGTETALKWNGNIDGAISSGERAANEVMEAEKSPALVK